MQLAIKSHLYENLDKNTENAIFSEQFCIILTMGNEISYALRKWIGF